MSAPHPDAAVTTAEDTSPLVAPTHPAVDAEQPAHTIEKPAEVNEDGWLPAVDEPLPVSPTAHTSEASGATAAHTRSASVRSKRSAFTNRDGDAVVGSTFGAGAGTTGPNATHETNDAMNLRAASAEVSLTPSQRAKILKQEIKDGKRLAKVIKQEAKAEKQAMAVAIKELSELQKIQAAAVKREGKVHTTHAKALTAFQKYEAEFLAARTQYEQAQAKLASETETLEITRSNAREATEKLQEKSTEVDSLRTTLGVDERERGVKLVELTGKKSGSRWSFLG